MTRDERWLLIALVAASMTLLSLSRALRPDPRGYGTHAQLFLSPCGLMEATGIPCPTCGMTTSFAHMARLQPALAFKAHPLGALAYIAIALQALLVLRFLVRGDSYLDWIERWPWRKIAVIGGASVLLAWIFKIRDVLG